MLDLLTNANSYWRFFGSRISFVGINRFSRSLILNPVKDMITSWWHLTVVLSDTFVRGNHGVPQEHQFSTGKSEECIPLLHNL